MSITKQTLDFLVENRLRNDRDWFHAHKVEYHALVLEPMAGLVNELAPTVSAIDPLLITEPKVDKTLSRIYRDTRFSKDKSLYRDVMWCVFTRDRKQFPEYPALVLEFSPNGYRYGCGYFLTPPKVMEQLRAMVLEEAPAYLAAERFLTRQDACRVEGECYKRPRYPEYLPQRRDWLERKNAYVMRNSTDFDRLFSPGFGKALAGEFEALAPIYQFFVQARERVTLDRT